MTHRLTKRLFTDKNIGKNLVIVARCYTIDKPNWENYNSQITNTYSSNFKHLDSVLTDTVVSQTNKIRDLDISNYNQSREIRELQTAIKQLNEHCLQDKEKLHAISKNMEYLTYGIYGIYERFAELSRKVDELSKK